MNILGFDLDCCYVAKYDILEYVGLLVVDVVICVTDFLLLFEERLGQECFCD
ncbi:MAG TPA: hypothetical protein VJ583_07490 [Nitrososphaeraceae archaeon]|nr:hypothetical protein [Nitrososphaeraceae archaeon]